VPIEIPKPAPIPKPEGLIVNSLPPTLIQSPPPPIKKEPELAFGFVDVGTINALNENNQWKDRTVAID